MHPTHLCLVINTPVSFHMKPWWLFIDLLLHNRHLLQVDLMLLLHHTDAITTSALYKLIPSCHKDFILLYSIRFIMTSTNAAGGGGGMWVMTSAVWQIYMMSCKLQKVTQLFMRCILRRVWVLHTGVLPVKRQVLHHLCVTAVSMCHGLLRDSSDNLSRYHFSSSWNQVEICLKHKQKGRN